MSEPMLQIGNNIDKGYVTDVATAIDTVFKSGYENRVEQETLRAALLVLKEMSNVSNVAATNSVFNNGTSNEKVVADDEYADNQEEDK